jgi:hypothetical protein
LVGYATYASRVLHECGMVNGLRVATV